MRTRIALLLLLPLCLLPACRDPKVAAYSVPAEKAEPLPPILTGATPATPATTAAPADMAGTAVPTSSGDGLTWTAPAHWKTKPAGAMRKGSYAISGANDTEADLSITAFPGDVGGDLANINRWRGQLSLPPITAADLPNSTEHLDFNGLHFTFVELANPGAPDPQRILGASIPVNGSTWFVKLMGPDALVAGERAAFREFLSTINASAPAAR